MESEVIISYSFLSKPGSKGGVENVADQPRMACAVGSLSPSPLPTPVLSFRHLGEGLWGCSSCVDFSVLSLRCFHLNFLFVVYMTTPRKQY